MLLIGTFVSLIGLKLCIPETPNGKFEADIIEKFWTHSNILRIVYGLCNIIGVIFVLGVAGYMTFFKHWWYILVYIGAVLGAMLIAFIFRLLLIPFYRLCNEIYREVVVQRICGIIIIIIGMIISCL